ncbi:hypothetical protein ACTWP5_01705 [Streptomyces sp. 4N509B]|uniref:hypothetical protein n=1 Tax=Streptomyces sp. 4N509B TaxID=3457413 RepID=UPI003FD2811D
MTDATSADAAASDAASAEAASAEERLARAVAAAETALIEFEIAVETFRIEVANFSRLHDQRLGPLHARIEEVEAHIAEAVAARTGDPTDQRRAVEARARVTPLPPMSAFLPPDPAAPASQDPASGATPDTTSGPASAPPPAPARVRPDPEARALYRDLVRLVHPDLATDEPDRVRRDAFLARVNASYARGDADELRALTAEWRETGGEPRRPGVAELAARLEWMADRKEWLAKEVAELEASAIGSLIRLAPDDPDGLLDAIAADLHRTLAAREAELATLLGHGPDAGRDVGGIG